MHIETLNYFLWQPCNIVRDSWHHSLHASFSFSHKGYEHRFEKNGRCPYFKFFSSSIIRIICLIESPTSFNKRMCSSSSLVITRLLGRNQFKIMIYNKLSDMPLFWKNIKRLSQGNSLMSFASTFLRCSISLFLGWLHNF